jgi:DNA polymerase I-like protein with 3'-5' exonuclease and polymerase domains
MRKRAAVDFETEAIGSRPDAYPPVPVGVAIREGGRSEYLSWGHKAGGNNTTLKEAKRRLAALWKTHKLIFHNGAFDIEVGMKHMGLPFPEDWEDTLLLAYLNNPRSSNLSLKPLSAMMLNMPADEQEELRDWILANVPEAAKKKKDWGAYISFAPGNKVAPYAKGDVLRTDKMFALLYKRVGDAGMLSWYEKEKQVIGVKLKMEQGGIRVNARKLRKDLPMWERLYADLEKDLRKRLNITPKWEAANCTEGRFNPSSGPQLAKALKHSGKVKQFIMTDKGNPSTKRVNLEAVCKDKDLVRQLAWHGIAETYLSTFIRPWLERAEVSGGYIYPTFNTVRSTDEYGNKGGVGTRTGRLSSSDPNLQNIPASVEESQHAAILIPFRDLLKAQYGFSFVGMRDYFIPDEGCVFIGRDYSQQELRILAHYEDGILLHMYHENPSMDIHATVSELVHQDSGILVPRKKIKIVNFSIVYGAGVDKLAGQLDTDRDDAQRTKAAVLRAVPGIKELNKELMKMARRNEPLRTWGGRLYYCEPPRIVKGKMRSFEYKMLNLLIQGSAADCTKQAMINVDSSLNRARLVLQVHDELLACAPKGHEKKEMALMKEAMEDVKFDLPMLTDGKTGSVSWARMK